jgi:methyl-accepting chemotaxis protein
MSLAQRLLLISGALIVLLLALAVTVRIMMLRLSQEADQINLHNVPQLQLIAEMELNVTRVSLQVRHAILSRTPAELEATLADINGMKALLHDRLQRFSKNIGSEDERRAFEQVPGLMAKFWDTGGRNLALIQAGRKDEAFAFLVEQTIPARNALLAPLGEEKNRQGQALLSHISGVKDLADHSQGLVVSAVIAVAMGLTGLAIYLQRVTRQLGADPAELKRVADAVARGKLDVDIHVRPGDSTSTLSALRDMVERLAHSVRAVRSGAESVSTASNQIAAGNHDLSGRTEQQVSSLMQTASSMDQLSQTVGYNADNASKANQLAQTASDLALKGGDVVGEVIATMKAIEDSSHRISDIIGTIDGIAFQTNILALNAAVEAARAGDQGRGFAVVASEVRSLAQRSAGAAKQIKELITSSAEQVQLGARLVDAAGSTMSEVVASIGHVTVIMQEISLASTTQRGGVVQVGTAVAQMDRATQQNAALVEEMSASAASLSQQAHDLVEAVAFFRLTGSNTGSGSQRLPV